MPAATDSDRSQTRVLVTGASGFIGLHCVRELLEQGYRVRGTLRTPAREPSLRDVLAKRVDVGDRLEFVTSDLTRDDGWGEAVAGCRYVLHVASPLPRELPKHEDEIIVPAREGTLRVLRAASDSGVERVVLTSSVAAIAAGHERDGAHVFDENDWSILEGIPPYEKSKTIAERAAWDFVDGLVENRRIELVAINPGLVLGPILEEDYGTSAEAIGKLMRREFPGCPRLGWPLVDVRDVASAHVAAMTEPDAAGQRFCCCVEFLWMSEIAAILNTHFAKRGYRIPTRPLPDFLVRLAALFDKTTRVVVGDLGKRTEVSNERIVRVLGWKPRSPEEMIIAMGESLIEQGVV
jgi:nucleoside-diphosphate-sugar epimerase